MEYRLKSLVSTIENALNYHFKLFCNTNIDHVNFKIIQEACTFTIPVGYNFLQVAIVLNWYRQKFQAKFWFLVTAWNLINMCICWKEKSCLSFLFRILSQIRYWYLGSFTCGLIQKQWCEQRSKTSESSDKFFRTQRFNSLSGLIWVNSEQMHTQKFDWERRMQWQSGVRTPCTSAYLVTLTHGLISFRNWSVITWRWRIEHLKGCIN